MMPSFYGLLRLPKLINHDLAENRAVPSPRVVGRDGDSATAARIRCSPARAREIHLRARQISLRARPFPFLFPSPPPNPSCSHGGVSQMGAGVAVGCGGAGAPSSICGARGEKHDGAGREGSDGVAGRQGGDSDAAASGLAPRRRRRWQLQMIHPKSQASPSTLT